MKRSVLALSVVFAGGLAAASWADMPMTPSKPYAPTAEAPKPADTIEPAAPTAPAKTAAEPANPADATADTPSDMAVAKPEAQPPKRQAKRGSSNDHVARVLNRRELRYPRYRSVASYGSYGAYNGQYGPNPYSSQGN